MKQDNVAFMELRYYQLKTDIGTYGPNETKPDFHLLDLTLGIAVNQVVINQDGMAHVFDYDSLILDIDGIAGDGHYETQERLVTRIALACVAYPAITTLEIGLKKSPVRSGKGSLGVRLKLSELATVELRSQAAKVAP